MVRVLFSLLIVSFLSYHTAHSQANSPKVNGDIEISLKDKSKVLIYHRPLDYSIGDFSKFLPQKLLPTIPLNYHSYSTRKIVPLQSRVLELNNPSLAKPLGGTVRVNIYPLDKSLIPSIEKTSEY